MRKRLLLMLLLALTVASLTTTLAGAKENFNGPTLTTTLTGAAEVPGPGDPDGSGTATVTLLPGKEMICYTLNVSGIATPTGAHIHEAPAGSSGGVVVPLAAPASGTSSGCKAVARETIIDILTNPSDYYVNVHNADFPGGALRGQLTR